MKEIDSEKLKETWKTNKNLYNIAEELAIIRLNVKKQESIPLMLLLDTVGNYYNKKQQKQLLIAITYSLF